MCGFISKGLNDVTSLRSSLVSRRTPHLALSCSVRVRGGAFARNSGGSRTRGHRALQSELTSARGPDEGGVEVRLYQSTESRPQNETPVSLQSAAHGVWRAVWRRFDAGGLCAGGARAHTRGRC